MTGLDSEHLVLPTEERRNCECRSAPSHHEIGGTAAVQSEKQSPSRGYRHATCEPGPESAPPAKCAPVFGQLEVLSGESRICEADATTLALNKINEFLRLLRRSNAFPGFDTYPTTAEMKIKVL